LTGTALPRTDLNEDGFLVAPRPHPAWRTGRPPRNTA